MIMDMQIGILCGIFSILASVIVYAILSFYSIKEDSFDEAKANRRKLIKEYMDQSRTTLDKSKQKKTKKNIKKTKEKKPDQVDDDLEDQKENNQHETMKEPIKDISHTKKTEPPKTTVKAKIQSLAPVEKEVDANSTATQLSESILKKGNEKKLKMKSLEKTPEPESQIEQPIPKETEKKVKVEGKVEKKKQGDIPTFRKAASTEKQVVNVNSVLTVIRKAELSRTEIQLLIDTLLNSYEDETSDWLKVKKLDSGRQDSTAKLKKQLLELETSLKNEKQITLSLQGKLKELRTEMALDKNSCNSLKEAVNRMQQEKDDIINEKCDLSAKLKSITQEKDDLQEKLNQELAKTRSLKKQDDDRHHDEIISLKKQIGSLTGQLESEEKNNALLKTNVLHLEEQLALHKNCEERISDLGKTCNIMECQLKENERELSNLNQHISSLNLLVEEIKSENQNLRREKEELNGQLSSYFSEIQNLKEEIETNAIKLSEIQNVQKNGDVSECYDNNHDPLKCEYLLEEKENLLKHLNIELDRRTDSLNELTLEIKKVTLENKKLTSLVEEASKDNTALKKSTYVQIDELKQTISQLRDNMNDKIRELSTLNDEVEKYKQRNNELRNKNWKLVEALTERERALQNKLKAEDKLENKVNSNVKNDENCAIKEVKNSVNTFVQRLFPDIKLQENKGHFNDWLRSVEEAINASSMKYFSRDLLEQNSQLQSLVTHYKGIISDTEDMLYRLQNHIEVTESKWLEERNNMQKELETLRSSLGDSVQ